MAGDVRLVPEQVAPVAEVAGPEAVPSRGRGPWSLRRRLVVLDAATVAAVWMAVAVDADLPTSWAPGQALFVLPVTAATILALALERLYRRRVVAVRSEEVARLARAVAMSATAVASLAWAVGAKVGTGTVLGGSVAAFVALAVVRGSFAQWLRDQRARGRFLQPVLILGDDDEALGLVRLLDDCPEVGFRPVGMVRRAPSQGRGTDGGAPTDEAADVVAAVRRAGATGVLVTAQSLGSPGLSRLVRALHGAGIHVHISSGMALIHRRRLRVEPIAHEALLHVEPPSLTRPQLAMKRMVDVGVALAALLLLAPVLAVAAVAIKVEDGGPVVFRQRRVGRGGSPFRILKLRTMAVDAERRVHEVRDRNARTGPLLKVADDPRVTRVGRVLRATSLDEVPQLVNVLRGEMSIVGPRPALPEEVMQFDADLLDRLDVKPGVSGLWQVEARHKASFEQYRRLDLFYVENWSLSLDLSIMLSTLRVLLRRTGRAVSVERAHPPLAVVPMAEAGEPS